MKSPGAADENHLRNIVRECVRRELIQGSIPGDDEDLMATGALDSMAWVGVLECIESLTGIRGLAERIRPDEPRTIRVLVERLYVPREIRDRAAAEKTLQPGPPPAGLVAIQGWGTAFGSEKWDAAILEQNYSLAPGTLRDRAGIESATRIGAGEDEISLALRAASDALQEAQCDVSQLDCIIACSETFLGLPSLAASLHARLLVPESCGAFDVGGACVGLPNGLFIAKSLLSAGMEAKVLVVTADVHSTHLGPGTVEGEFGALLGDGASAFVLDHVEADTKPVSYVLGEFHFGCAGTFASVLRVSLDKDGTIALKFDGEALARAAVSRLQRIIEDVSLRSGLSRAEASAFAIHQPNPRLVELLARQAEIPLGKFPPVAKTCGNLGSSTCGVALFLALAEHANKSREDRGPIFVAAVGPGLLWGGTVLY